jgi:RNA polymerase sigma-54 factor
MSMAMRAQQKQTLSLSLKTWLPLLQAPLQELDTLFRDYSYENPFLQVNSHFESNTFYSSTSDDKRDFIENISLDQESIYDKLSAQICEPIFPTPNSQKVALEIINHINNEGFLDKKEIPNIANSCNVTVEFVESIRQRFKYVEPIGVASFDMVESFIFQLEVLDIDEDLYNLTYKIVNNLKSIDKYYKHHRFDESKDIIKKFSNPPLIASTHLGSSA